MIDREGFPSSFSAPHEVDEILELLPPEVTLNVPIICCRCGFRQVPSTASWMASRSGVRKLMRKVADVGSDTTARPVRASSPS
jgi:hypothetical protein